MNQEQYDKLMAVIAQASNAADDMWRKWEPLGMNNMSELAAVRQRQCNEAFDIVMTLYAESSPASTWRCPVCGANSMEVCATRHPLSQCLEAGEEAVIDSGEGYSLGKEAAESLAGMLDEETMQQQTPLNGWLFVMNADKEEWGPKLPPSIISRINECCQKGFGNVTEADVPRAFAAGFKRAMIQGQAVS